MAQMIANDVVRTHQIKFNKRAIFAQYAVVAESDPKHPEEQIVSLDGAMIVAYEKLDSAVADTPKLYVPKEFYLAKLVTVFIRRDKHDNYTLEAKLEDPGGAMFPRHFTSSQGT